MDDAINRQGVIDFINDIEHRALKMSNANSEDILYKTVLATTKAIRGYCKLVPSAQPERPKGKWIHYDEGDFDYDYKCSNCGYTVWDDSDFCPNCGYDMREDGKQDGRIN